jgi:hypothetical protein
MHLYIEYIEGNIVEVSEQRAQEAVAAGRWEECFNPLDVESEIVHVYHKSHKQPAERK